MHDFETIEKSYFTIDFIFAGSIIYNLFRCVVSQHHSQFRKEFLVGGVEAAGAVYL